MWQEGIESGPSVEGAPVFERLRDKYQRMAASRK